MNRLLKIFFVLFFVRPLVLIILGLNIQNRFKLPLKGPAIIAANHNSHLDTLVLFALYPLSKIHRLRPVAAADYFLSNPLLKWFSLNVIGIIPINRGGRINKETIFSSCHKALDAKDILIIYPEGTRGEPEKTSQLKKGIYHLIKDRNDTQITPVITHGLGRALPRGEALFVPYNCDVVVGDSLSKTSSAEKLITQLSNVFTELLKRCLTFHNNLS